MTSKPLTQNQIEWLEHARAHHLSINCGREGASSCASLDRRGLLKSLGYGMYIITEAGRAALKDTPPRHAARLTPPSSPLSKARATTEAEVKAPELVNELWEALFNITKDAVPEELTDAVLTVIAERLLTGYSITRNPPPRTP